MHIKKVAGILNIWQLHKTKILFLNLYFLFHLLSKQKVIFLNLYFLFTTYLFLKLFVYLLLIVYLVKSQNAYIQR